MEQDTLDWLTTPEGTNILSDLAHRPLQEGDILREVERLRRNIPAHYARAAVELSLLRRRATTKFVHAEQMFFTRDGLEQASAAPVAAHRAARIAQMAGIAEIADLGCGIGGDALALAAVGRTVIAVDRDPIRLEMVRINAAVCGLTPHITTAQRDLLQSPPPSADLFFADPGRRAGRRRQFDPEAYEPPLSHVLGWNTHNQALVIKLAPGIDPSIAPTDAELEFVSLDGDLKEAVLWCIPTSHRRRASMLRRTTPHTYRTFSLTATDPAPPTQVAEPSAWLYEPDPAIIRAGLVTTLAQLLGAHQLDAEIAYLSADRAQASPFARIWPIYEWMPFQLKHLRARLRALDAGAVTVKKRGSPLDTDVLARQLSGPGKQPLVVVLTQHNTRPIALICGAPRGPDTTVGEEMSCSI